MKRLLGTLCMALGARTLAAQQQTGSQMMDRVIASIDAITRSII